VKNIPCYCIGDPRFLFLDCSQLFFYIKLVKQSALLSRFADECSFNILTLLNAREYSPNTTFLVFRYNP